MTISLKDKYQNTLTTDPNFILILYYPDQQIKSFTFDASNQVDLTNELNSQFGTFRYQCFDKLSKSYVSYSGAIMIPSTALIDYSKGTVWLETNF